MRASIQHSILRRSHFVVLFVDDNRDVRILIYELQTTGLYTASDGRYEVYDCLYDAIDDVVLVQQLRKWSLLLLPPFESHYNLADCNHSLHFGRR